MRTMGKIGRAGKRRDGGIVSRIVGICIRFADCIDALATVR